MLRLIQQARESGSAHGLAELSLVSNVRHLDPESAVFAGMISGWEDQQRSRFLRTETIEQRVAVVRRSRRSPICIRGSGRRRRRRLGFPRCRRSRSTKSVFDGPRVSVDTAVVLRLLIDQRYGWVAKCVERFGSPPTQILHEWNTVVRFSDFEGRPGRRALT